jgi:superfamily II DNA or RNA helicase
MSFQADDRVRLRDQPERQGTITGRTQVIGTYLHWEVKFGPTERRYHLESVLVPIDEQQTIEELFAAGVFAGTQALRRLITYERLQSGQTDFFYSMESNRTDFHPHQFKPVLKFVGSVDGRLLIADEVGLGKTIEAMYIWRELQARIDARRLLIVCPSKLKEKWRMEIRQRFGLSAEVADARRMVELCKEIAAAPSLPAVVVASLESLRPPKKSAQDAPVLKPRAVLAELLENYNPDDDTPLFDLVVIDEAHYLRNSSTSHYALGEMLRDACRHIVLLSATPIQTGIQNLHTLIELLDGEAYPSWQRDSILRQHTAFVRAMRLLWCTPVDTEALSIALDGIEVGRSTEPSDTFIAGLRQLIAEPELLTPARRIEACRQLDALSPLGSKISRSLKRHVLQNRVRRTAKTHQVVLTELELEVYNRLSSAVLKRAFEQKRETVAHLMLVGRQRQLASSFVATLLAWKDAEALEDEPVSPEAEGETMAEPRSISNEVARGLEELERLESCDSKYATLKRYLEEIRQQANQEKVIIFAFFRATLRYLERRLIADGFGAVRIDGETPVEERGSHIERFRDEPSVTVLLSSEVGAEGLDLQFCRIVINYDLPWNPMRVEQRIGRIDRLGQTAEKITVVSFFCDQTIEDRVVQRLYKRIGVFEECIGDLEEVMGEQVSEMILQALNPHLSDEEREEQVRQNELALAQTISTQRDIESEAANLAGFYDYILEMVRGDHDSGRWLAPNDLRDFVVDFLVSRFRGVRVEQPPEAESSLVVELSDEARRGLSRFMANHPQLEKTRLHLMGAGAVRLSFDPQFDTEGSSVERITFSHPLIAWIRTTYQSEPMALSRSFAARIASTTRFADGTYVIYGQRWHIEALQREVRLVFRACHAESGDLLDHRESEALLQSALNQGEGLTLSARAHLADLGESLNQCWVTLTRDLEERQGSFLADNQAIIERMIRSVERARDRRIQNIAAKVAQLQQSLYLARDERTSEQLQRRLSAQKGQVTRAENDAQGRIDALTAQRELRTMTFQDLVGCIIQVGG